MLYLVDMPMADIGLRAADDDPDARIVLIQDGVLLTPELDVPTYAVRRDAAARGIELPPGVEPVTYEQLVELLFQHEVKSFL